MFDEIVVGVNFRAGGDEAVALAQRLISRQGGITLAHVVLGDPAVFSEQSQAVVAQERARSLDLLDRERKLVHLRDAGAGRSATIEIRSVFAASVRRGLHAAVHDRRADLLVLGASRRSRVGRALAGDDVREVLNKTPCPVAIAPSGYRGDSPVRRVGVGYDGSAESRPAVDVARALAAEHGAGLAGLTVVSAISGRGPQPIGQVIRAADRGDAMDAPALRGEFEVYIAPGHPTEELAAFSHKVDLLVVSPRYLARGRRISRRGTSGRLARLAACPLLVVDGGPRRRGGPGDPGGPGQGLSPRVPAGH